MHFKTGLLDDEINTLTKILFVAVVMLSFILVAVKVSFRLKINIITI